MENSILFNDYASRKRIVQKCSVSALDPFYKVIYHFPKVRADFFVYDTNSQSTRTDNFPLDFQRAVIAMDAKGHQNFFTDR